MLAGHWLAATMDSVLGNRALAQKVRVIAVPRRTQLLMLANNDLSVGALRFARIVLGHRLTMLNRWRS